MKLIIMIFHLFNPFFILISFSLFTILISCLVEFKSLKHLPFFSAFTVLLSITTVITACCAIYHTNGITLFSLVIPVLLYFVLKKEIVFNTHEFRLKLKKRIKLLILLIPVLLLQAILNYDFKNLIPYKVSDDIYLYATIANQMKEFGQENTSAFLYGIYPNLFKGIQPYHYFELWLNNFFSLFSKYEVNNLIFITYPYLIWIFLIGILSIFENFNLKSGKIKIILPLLLLFTGPFYISNYQQILNDGNFFDSSVFTITGFVKQTLSFSYYGQKHLPVYLFSVLLILGFLHSKLKITLFAVLGAAISSIGVFPGFFLAALTTIISKNRLRKNWKSFIGWFLLFISFIFLIKFFQIGISKEIELKTNYSNYFLQNLNLKGEILRVVEKIIFPITWLFILYTPYIIWFIIFRKEFTLNTTKTTSIFIITSYLASVCFTTILYGINSDQFFTNLIPFYNLIVICIIIKILSSLDFKSVKYKFSVLTLIVISSYNVYKTMEFHFIPEFKKNINQTYSVQSQNKILKSFETSKPHFIGYILSKEEEEKHHPIHYHPYYPGKFLMDYNYFNFINLNYPYVKFKLSTSSNAFSPRNQLKYFVETRKLKNKNFENIQVRFCKEFKINYILCSKGTNLPSKLRSYVVKKIYDKKSKENYYILNFSQ